jgi:hypothetical protein
MNAPNERIFNLMRGSSIVWKRLTIAEVPNRSRMNRTITCQRVHDADFLSAVSLKVVPLNGKRHKSNADRPRFCTSDAT